MALEWVLHSFVGVGPRVHHSFPRGLGEHHMSPLEELGVRHTNLLQELLGIHMNLVRVPHILHLELEVHYRNQRTLWIQQYCFPLPISRHLHSLKTLLPLATVQPVYHHLH